MNETTTVRRVAATLTIGSFSLAALMGIVALLGGGDFGESEARVLLTTLIVGCGSICMLCYLATAGTRWVGLGVAGALVLILPTATSMLLVWSDWDGDDSGLLKSFGVGVVVASTVAQVCLLLALAGERDSLRAVLRPTVVLAGVLAFLISGLILDGGDIGDLWRLIGVIAILDVLGTLVTIALAKFGGHDEPAGSQGDVLRLRLSPDQAVALDALSRRTGQSREHLVVAAVDQFLQG